eukprot:3148809-Pleurochrysis_carterae.AAC.1
MRRAIRTLTEKNQIQAACCVAQSTRCKVGIHDMRNAQSEYICEVESDDKARASSSEKRVIESYYARATRVIESCGACATRVIESCNARHRGMRRKWLARTEEEGLRLLKHSRTALCKASDIVESCRSPKSNLTIEKTRSQDAEFGEIEKTILAAFRHSDSSVGLVCRQKAKISDVKVSTLSRMMGAAAAAAA